MQSIREKGYDWLKTTINNPQSAWVTQFEPAYHALIIKLKCVYFFKISLHAKYMYKSQIFYFEWMSLNGMQPIYLTQCWLIIKEVLWHSLQGNLYLNTRDMKPKFCPQSTHRKSLLSGYELQPYVYLMGHIMVHSIERNCSLVLHLPWFMVWYNISCGVLRLLKSTKHNAEHVFPIYISLSGAISYMLCVCYFVSYLVGTSILAADISLKWVCELYPKYIIIPCNFRLLKGHPQRHRRYLVILMKHVAIDSAKVPGQTPTDDFWYFYSWKWVYALIKFHFLYTLTTSIWSACFGTIEECIAII